MASKYSSSKYEQRAFIKACTLLGEKPVDIYEKLVKVYSYDALAYSTVRQWDRQVKEGREDIEDEARSGRPKSASTSGIIAIVEELINDDPHLSVIEIAETVDISTGAVHHILHDVLNLRKVSARWIPKLLTKDQKKQRVSCAKKLIKKYEDCDTRRLYEIVTGDETWIKFSEPERKERSKAWLPKNSIPLTKPRPDFREEKVLYSIFFDAYGPVAQIPVPKGGKINGDFYSSKCLREVEDFYKTRRPSTGARGIKLLHDNARPHVSKLTRQTIDEIGFEVLEHPPYSPDLSPCDFWLFPEMKKHLGRKHFSTRSDLGTAVYHYLHSIERDEYKKTFSKWIERLKLCIDNQGEYFKHIM